jgi:phage FluMu protein Com
MPIPDLMEFRCHNPRCGSRRSRLDGTPANPKMLCRFVAGGLNRYGMMEIRCPVCKAISRLLPQDQFGNQTSVFKAGHFHVPPRHDHRLMTSTTS